MWGNESPGTSSYTSGFQPLISNRASAYAEGGAFRCVSSLGAAVPDSYRGHRMRATMTMSVVIPSQRIRSAKSVGGPDPMDVLPPLYLLAVSSHD